VSSAALLTFANASDVCHRLDYMRVFHLRSYDRINAPFVIISVFLLTDSYLT